MELEQFKEIPKGEIFRTVITKYHSVHYGPGRTLVPLLFVCKKGHGYDDWTIYCHFPEKGVDYVAKHGDKVTSERNIRSIFPCSDEIYNLYRL